MVILFIAWDFITGLILWAMQSIPFIRSRMAVREIAQFDLVSVIRGLTISPYKGVLWTVLQLIIFVILASYFYGVLKNKYLGIVTLVLTLVIGMTEWNIPILIHGNMYLFLYLLGAYIGLHFFDKIISTVYSSLFDSYYSFGNIICSV